MLGWLKKRPSGFFELVAWLVVWGIYKLIEGWATNWALDQIAGSGWSWLRTALLLLPVLTWLVAGAGLIWLTLKTVRSAVAPVPAPPPSPAPPPPTVPPAPQPNDLRSRSYFKAESVRLADLVTIDNVHVADKTFEDCEILGPAIVGNAGGWGTISESRFDGFPEVIFLEMPPGKRGQLGVIGIARCVFRRCRFRGIGLIGTAQEIADMKAGFLNVQPPAPPPPPSKPGE